MDALGTKMTSVGYKGSGPAMTDLLGGQVDLTCDQTTNTTNHIKSGKIKAFAVTTKERLSSLPDLPTLDEAGLKGFEVTAWHGLYAPAGTPKEMGLSEFLCTGHGLNIGGSGDLEALVEQDRELRPGHGPFPGWHSPLPLGQVQ